MNQSEIARVQKYLRGLFGSNQINLQAEASKDGSVEVNVGDEFIGVINRDEEDGEVSYAFNMAILSMDLPED